jgi:putative Mg2+ transporter-C (MgtC) family protein
MAELTIPYWEVVLRLMVAALLCGAIGFEREVRDQPAGFRTHILLGLGATLFTLVSAYGFEPFTRAALGSGGLQFDPTRIAAQIVAGVGFLGAGAIIRQGGDVRGLTTAASLWAASAIGMAVGAGYLFGAAAATVLAMATLYALRRFRSSIISPLRLDSAGLELGLKDRGSSPANALQVLRRHNISIRSMDAEIDKERLRYNLQVRVHPSTNVHAVLTELSGLPEVERIILTGLKDYE